MDIKYFRDTIKFVLQNCHLRSNREECQREARGRESAGISSKVKMTKNPTILLLGLHPRENHTQHSICSFNATLSIAAKTRAQPNISRSEYKKVYSSKRIIRLLCTKKMNQLNLSVLARVDIKYTRITTNFTTTLKNVKQNLMPFINISEIVFMDTYTQGKCTEQGLEGQSLNAPQLLCDGREERP